MLILSVGSTHQPVVSYLPGGDGSDWHLRHWRYELHRSRPEDPHLLCQRWIEIFFLFFIHLIGTVNMVINLQKYCLDLKMQYWKFSFSWNFGVKSSLEVKSSNCQCRSRNSPGFISSTLRSSGIWEAADETVLNKVHKKIKKNLTVKG